MNKGVQWAEGREPALPESAAHRHRPEPLVSYTSDLNDLQHHELGV